MISPALFRRLHQAVQSDRKSDAVLLLSQVFNQQNMLDAERNHIFVSGLRHLGDNFFESGEIEEAERHYRLAVELFDKFFAEDVREGLALNRRLCELYEKVGAEEKLHLQMDRAYELVKRMLTNVATLPMSMDMERTGTGSSASVSADASSSAQAEVAAKALNILLIEDNPDDASFVQDSLEEAGVPLSIDWADSLSSGLARMHENPVDVVLLDLALPDSQNLQTIRKIQSDAPRVPIVVLTGNDDKELILEALRTGARDYLIKGRVDTQQLVGSLHTAVQSRVSSQAAEWETKLRLDSTRQMLKFMSTAALVLDTKYSIVEANRQFCELMPSTEDYIRGSSFMEFCPHFPRGEFDELVATGGRRRFDARLESRTVGSIQCKAEAGTIVDSFHRVRWIVVQFTVNKD